MRQLAAMNQEMQELLYVSSHDLRSPLVTIQGFANSLERKICLSIRRARPRLSATNHPQRGQHARTD